jgi:hypothetical protein
MPRLKMLKETFGAVDVRLAARPFLLGVVDGFMADEAPDRDRSHPVLTSLDERDRNRPSGCHVEKLRKEKISRPR